MNSATSRKPDREHLLAVVDALGCRKRIFGAILAADWNIIGRNGHIWTDGIRSYVYLRYSSKWRWEKAKRALSFLTVTQDGDDEGVFRLSAIPTPEQVATLRKHLGLRRATPRTDEQTATLRRFSFARDKTPVSEPSVANSDEAAMYPPHESSGRL